MISFYCELYGIKFEDITTSVKPQNKQQADSIQLIKAMNNLDLM